MQPQINRIIVSSDQIQERVKTLAGDIQREIIADEEWVVLILLKGALFFATDLCMYLPENIQIECVRVSSYKGGLKSSGEVDFGVFPEVAGKSILVIDDILDTGLTLEQVTMALMKKGASQVKTCVLLTKENTQIRDVKADYTGFTIPNEFVVGYGLDYQDKLRNLPHIAVLS